MTAEYLCASKLNKIHVSDGEMADYESREKYCHYLGKSYTIQTLIILLRARLLYAMLLLH